MNNADRNLVKMIREICAEEGIGCRAFSYDWILLLEKGGQKRRILGYKFELNPDAPSRICEDKAAASELLLDAGVPAVPHHFFLSPANLSYIGQQGNWKRLMGLLQQHGRLVCKDNFGTGGNQVFLVTSQGELEKAAAKIFAHSYGMAVSPYMEIQKEYRVILLDGQVKLMFSKHIPCLIGDGRSTVRQLLVSYMQQHEVLLCPEWGEQMLASVPARGEVVKLHWKYNLGQGATATLVEDDRLAERLRPLALAAANAIGIRFASVDIVDTPQGLLVLELNSGVMTEHFSRVSEEYYQMAKAVYREAVQRMFAQE